MNIMPTPEFMEALGRADEKYGNKRQPYGAIQEEMQAMRDGDPSVRAGITDEQAQHRAVARRFPHLYI